MSEKSVKSRLLIAFKSKQKHVGTNIFKMIRRHQDGVQLVLQEGLEASLMSEKEILIKGARIEVRYDTSDGPVGQMKFVPATLEGIKSAEAELQHLAYEHGLSSDDMTGVRHHVSHSNSPSK